MTHLAHLSRRERINFRAAALGLWDLRSTALSLMLEEMGLACPSRWVFCLRQRGQPGPNRFPAFFNVMVHLAIHLPEEAILRGPVQYDWMFPIERRLLTCKRYVRNMARPEGSIAEGMPKNSTEHESGDLLGSNICSVSRGV